MKRRQLVFSAATFALLSGCGGLPNLGLPATPRVARVGILKASAANNPVRIDDIGGLTQGLADRGYVAGQTIIFEQRASESLSCCRNWPMSSCSCRST